jgi:hypothetical protein
LDRTLIDLPLEIYFQDLLELLTGKITPLPTATSQTS